MTGEQMYTAYRAAHKRAAQKRGSVCEPRWKDLKPWVKRIWDRAAESL